MIKVSDLSLFRKFIILLASTCGQLLNLSSISNSIGVSHNTIKAWLSALEMSYIVFLLQPFHANYKKRLIKTPKVYFYDTGLAAALLKIKSVDELKNHYIKGSFFENIIINEYIKHSYNTGEVADYYFWRDHNGNEIDLLYEEKAQTFPIEIKSAKTLNNDFFTKIKKFCAASDIPIKNASLIYGGTESQTRFDISVIPWNRLFK